MQNIIVPTVNNGWIDYDKLFDLMDVVINAVIEECEIYLNPVVILDFSECTFLHPHAVAFLGGLIRFVQKSYEEWALTMEIAWETIKPDIYRVLRQNGFALSFGGAAAPYHGSHNAVPYREDAEHNKGAIINYLRKEWLMGDKIFLSDKLRRAIVSNVLEIYDNAFNHSSSPIGAISCGQYFPNQHKLKLTVVDFGRGIAKKVKSFLKKPIMADADALKWAFERGHTTSNSGMGRGMGLDLLKEFVKLNHGVLKVRSQHGAAMICSTGDYFSNRRSNFDGTLVSIELRCDDGLLYQFAQEEQEIEEEQNGEVEPFF